MPDTITKARLLAVFLLVGGCTATKSYEMGSTPRMIAICQSQNEGMDQTLAYAEQQCQKHGRHAALMAESGQRCSFGPMTTMGYVTQFQCVR